MTKHENVKISKSEWSHAGEWRDYAAAVESRLAQGERDYGDKSFSKSPAKLIEEIRQELRDVSGWAFVLDRRLQRIADVLDGLAATCKHATKK